MTLQHTGTPARTSAIVIGSKTLVVGGSAITQSGQTLSLASPAWLVLDGETLAVGNSAVVQSGRTLLPAAPSWLVVDGQTASAITPSGTLSDESVIIGTQAYTASGVPQTGVVVAGQTIFPGASALIGGATISLSSGNLVVASGTSTTVVTLTTVLSGNQVVTLGTQAYTASVVQTSAVGVGGHTVVLNVATIIDGETVSLARSQLIVASGSQTSAVSLGGAIMSGIGGQASSTSVEPYTGEGRRVTKRPISLVFMVLVLVMLVM